ncbi:MAG TPA: hypothetical protein VK735_22305, partial [Pseudonocardia sp.]|uniref:hypothetical protein n=1 Tax=Pseudonocardia sp. TaxID=60912 RepID=UPI002CF3BFCC
MQRSWVLLPVAVVALLISRLDTPTLPDDYVDPVALATATAIAGWHCVVPHRSHRVQLRATGKPPLTVTATDLTAEPPTARPGPGKNPRAQISGELTSADDVESFQVPMRAGEVLGVTMTGGARQLEL